MIENRGKALQFIKLCEDWNVDFKIEKVKDNPIDIQSTQYFQFPTYRYVIRSMKYPDEFEWFITPDTGDKWGTLIDILVEFKYTEGYERAFEKV